MMKGIIFLVLLLLSPSVLAGRERAKSIEFPGSLHSVLSPDGKAIISNEDRGQTPNHILYLNFIDTPSKILVSSYNRHVDVLWSPDSHRFFLNDYAESNEADCILINRSTMKKTSMARALMERRKISHLENDETHLYVTCDEWKGAHIVVVSARGYDGAKSGEIERVFMYDAEAGHIEPAHYADFR